MLTLDTTMAIAQGKVRTVYPHPNDPDLIIKVFRPEAIAERTVDAPWYKRRRRHRHLLIYLREIREHIALYAQYGEPVPFVQKIIGFQDTNFGLGLVSEAVRDRTGNYAPTLRQLIRRGRYGPVERAAFEAFAMQVVDSPLVLGDFHMGNVLYGYSEEHGDHFVLIDGVGDKNVIPLQSWSRRINRYWKRRLIAIMRDKIEQALEAAPTPDKE